MLKEKTLTKEQLAELDRRLEEKNSESYLYSALNYINPFSSKGSLSNVNFTSKHMGGSYNKKKKRSYKRRVKRTHRKQH